jgi:hypothetical protein
MPNQPQNVSQVMAPPPAVVPRAVAPAAAAGPANPRLARLSNFFGRNPTGQQFGLAKGVTNKYTYDSSTKLVDWKGVSGLLQFFHKYPMGFTTGMKQADWTKTFNQIFWNILIFVIGFGFLYSMNMSSFSVPEEMDKQVSNPVAKGMYFSVVTMTTLGFGDITPSTVGGQVLVMFHIMLFFLFNFIWAIDFKPEKLFTD